MFQLFFSFHDNLLSLCVHVLNSQRLLCSRKIDIKYGYLKFLKYQLYLIVSAKVQDLYSMIGNIKRWDKEKASARI